MRIDKNQYYMNIAKEVSARSTCLSLNVGAVLVKDDQIISTGYNGAPRGVSHCTDKGFCIRRKLNIPTGIGYEHCFSVHAEAGSIIQAAKQGISVVDSNIYIYAEKNKQVVTAFPCTMCKKFIINAGINTVFINDSENNIIRFSVRDWIKNMSKLEDLMEDKNIYGK